MTASPPALLFVESHGVRLYGLNGPLVLPPTATVFSRFLQLAKASPFLLPAQDPAVCVPSFPHVLGYSPLRLRPFPEH